LTGYLFVASLSLLVDDVQGKVKRGLPAEREQICCLRRRIPWTFGQWRPTLGWSPGVHRIIRCLLS